MKEILLVEDDEGLNNGIVLAFAGEDYRFCQCGTSAQARKALGEKQFGKIMERILCYHEAVKRKP